MSKFIGAMMTFKSACLKLTLFYVIIVMLISVSFSLVLYRLSDRELGNSLQRQDRIFQQFPPLQIIPQLHFNDLENSRIAQQQESESHLKYNLLYFKVVSSPLKFIFEKQFGS